VGGGIGPLGLVGPWIEYRVFKNNNNDDDYIPFITSGGSRTLDQGVQTFLSYKILSLFTSKKWRIFSRLNYIRLHKCSLSACLKARLLNPSL